MASLNVPVRTGPKPSTTPHAPHSQLDQLPSREMHQALIDRLFALPEVVEERSRISVPGARALVVPAQHPKGPPDSFMIGAEFAHVHPPYDGSLHVAVNPEHVDELMDTGWAEPHPMALLGVVPRNVVLVYAPRDLAEIDVVANIVEAARRRAFGER